jgi:16S rRNA G966 N2-methylase RsmD
MNTKISKDKFLSLRYPYYYLFASTKDIYNNFERLRYYNPKIITTNNKFRVNKFLDKYLILELSTNDFKTINKITDFFSEKCRVKCFFKTKTNFKSIYDHFQRNKLIIYNNIMKQNKVLNYNILDEYLYKKYNQCNNFNLSIVVSVLKLFNGKKYLDFAAGWGDRLIGAIAYGCDEYLGVDPSDCMEDKYKTIIDTLTTDKTKNNFKVIKSGFEEVNNLPDNHFDIVFTSPPFFDLEIYEQTNSQSITKFNTLDKWLNGFLFPSITKSYKTLSINGYLVLYISDYQKYKFVKRMKEFIKTDLPGFKYLGALYWTYKEIKFISQPIFVWKKIN